jgi:hypothetical protein
VFGIAITVVAIVVELAANRYTHRITELFVQRAGELPRDRLLRRRRRCKVVFVGITFDTLDGDAARASCPSIGHRRSP